MERVPFRLGVSLLVFLGALQSIHAQVITSAEIERGLRFPRTPSYDGEPYTQRYSYGTSGNINLNGDSRRIWYLDYLDRADRAQKFGYRMPIDPYFEDVPVEEAQPTVVAPPPPVRAGFGFGWFRRR